MRKRIHLLTVLILFMYSAMSCLCNSMQDPDRYADRIACPLNVIFTSSKTSERRLMIDQSATKEAFEIREIVDIG